MFSLAQKAAGTFALECIVLPLTTSTWTWYMIQTYCTVPLDTSCWCLVHKNREECPLNYDYMIWFEVICQSLGKQYYAVHFWSSTSAHPFTENWSIKPIEFESVDPVLTVPGRLNAWNPVPSESDYCLPRQSGSGFCFGVPFWTSWTLQARHS